MKPKDEAINIVLKYFSIYGYIERDITTHNFHVAIDCAVFNVNEMIKLEGEKKHYWFEVKRELETLKFKV